MPKHVITLEEHLAAMSWLNESPRLRHFGGEVGANVLGGKFHGSLFAIGKGFDHWFDLEWSGKSWKVTMPDGTTFRRRDNADAVPEALALLKAQGRFPHIP